MVLPPERSAIQATPLLRGGSRNGALFFFVSARGGCECASLRAPLGAPFCPRRSAPGDQAATPEAKLNCCFLVQGLGFPAPRQKGGCRVVMPGLRQSAAFFFDAPMTAPVSFRSPARSSARSLGGSATPCTARPACRAAAGPAVPRATLRQVSRCCLWVCAAAGLGAAPAWGQSTADAGTVVVTGAASQMRATQAPYAVNVISQETLRNAGPMINLSEALVQVPGLVVNNRSNYAQDLQISSRGFGARAGFGVRGIRLYADGIPASGPDGQGQVSHFDIAGAQRVEVLRGPFSVLYGNSSGGVIALFSAPATQREVQAGVDAGSFGLRQARLGVALPVEGGFDVRASVAHMQVDGFRPQSAAKKTQANARLGWQGPADTVTVQLSYLDQPADDPLGLERAQYELGPEQTAATALQNKTRKTTAQSQAGTSWRHRFNAGPLRESQVALYSGLRNVEQWLAIPAGTQNNNNHGGGVIAFDRHYGGLDARLRWEWEAAGLQLVTGASMDSQRDDRRGYLSFKGSVASPGELGVVGDLKRLETNRAQTRDLYVQGDLALGPTLSASAGLRSGRVQLSTADAYIKTVGTVTNGDDSGKLNFSYTNPVLGLRWQPAPGLNLYASAARGFESPTLGELAYKIDGTGGFNSSLKPQTSRQVEVGAKWRSGPAAAELALFDVQTSDEIAVASNSGGRSAFQNVGRTQRRGAELGLAYKPAGPLSAQLSMSTLRATYRDPFKVCAGTPCTAPTLQVAPGGHVAGAPSSNAWAELAYATGAWGTFAAELRSLGRVAVNDRNTDFAAGSTLGALRWSKSQPLGAFMGGSGLRLEWLLRVDNVANTAYAGSVIVNDANGRNFEPGAPRSVLLALRLVGAL